MADAITSEHNDYASARQSLVDAGMHVTVDAGNGDREYWGFGSNDVFRDHTGTVTAIGSKFYVADFTELREVVA